MEQFQEYAGIDEETARKAVEIYRERYAPVGIYENELYPGIPEMLSGLKQRGYKLAIASSKPENFVKIVAEYSILILILTRWLEVSLRADEPIRQR